MIELIHASDLHLGARRWLARVAPEALAPLLDHADRVALSQLVDHCIGRRARLLLLAGDVFDGWCRSFRVALTLVQELLRLRDAGVRVVLLAGNHDARNRWLRSLLLPDNARLIGRHGPETLVFDDLGIALHGWSAPEGDAGDVVQRYPDAVPGLVNVGLLHTSAEGVRGHVDYAPTSRLSLRRRGYDYFALGHVHRRQVLAAAPWVVFSGNLQARGSREGGAKGATSICIEQARVVRVEERALDAVRFDTVLVPDDDAGHLDDLMSRAREALVLAASATGGPPLVARLVFGGAVAAATLLAAPPWRRAAALHELSQSLDVERCFVDDARVEVADLGFALATDW